MQNVRNCEGSITLESAIVLPIFASLIMAFVVIIKIVLAQMALQHAVSQSVQLVSAYAYPLAVAQQSALGESASSAIDSVQTVSEQIEEVTTWLDTMDDIMPSSISDQLISVQEEIKQVVIHSVEGVVKPFFYPLLQNRLRTNVWLDAEKVIITDLTLPNFEDRSQPYFGLHVRYQYDVVIPFYETTVELEAKAYERVWYSE